MGRPCVPGMLVSSAVALLSLPALGMDIVKDGKPCATIVVADDADNYQKWAAEWLRDYIKLATGTELPIVSEGKSPSGALVSVGRTQLAEKAQITTDDLKYDGCKVVVRSNVLYLIGRDSVLPKGKAPDRAPNPFSHYPHGTVRAVTTFLEDCLGVRWLLPGPQGTFVPSVKDLSVPDNLSQRILPTLAYAHTGYDTPIANFANNGRDAANYYLMGGDGTWALCLGDKKYYQEHPEYFRMDDTGKRSPPVGQPMLCTSNREVWRIVAGKIGQLFDQGYEGVELGQSDGWAPCLCPACQTEFGDGRVPVSVTSPAERVWTMHKWIMDRLGETHPAKKVIVTVYGPSYYPSKRFDRLPDNVIAEMMCSPDDALWKGKVSACTVYDAYIWEEGCVPTGFVPAFGPEWLQKRARMWRECGVIGAYGGGRGSCWALGGPSFYAYAKLTSDPDVNLDKLLAEYCDGVYGEAGRTMERFFRVFHKRSNRTLDTRPRFENGYPAEDAFSLLYPPSVVNEMDRLLEHAEATAKSDRAKGWLKTTRDAFDGLKAISEMFVAKRAYEMQPTREMLQMVKQRVDAFEEWRMRIVHYSTDKAYVRDWFPGYYRLCSNLICAGDGYWWNHYFYHLDVLQADLQKVLKGEKKMRGTGVGPGTILAPLTWDFDKMMAGVGKPREEKVACVKRTAAKPGADGALDPKAWADAQPYLFEMYHAANSSVDKDKQTFVRLLYDDAHIYVRFECYEPRIGDMKLKSVGKDGDVYHQDEVELFLNPECSNRKFLHFMAAPVADAAYDERKGYFEDPLDPRYHIADVSWNAEWSYTYSIDRERNLWVVEMSVPFKSLGQSSPRPGTVWTGNFARARRAHGGEELSCWVAEEFGNPEVFGEITFGPEAVRPGQ